MEPENEVNSIGAAFQGEGSILDERSPSLLTTYFRDLDCVHFHVRERTPGVFDTVTNRLGARWYELVSLLLVSTSSYIDYHTVSYELA